MATIKRKRVIRPSSRRPSSSYRVHCDNVGTGDTLIVNITHESDTSVNFTYQVDGSEIAHLNSLHFDAQNVNGEWQISWKENVNIRRT